MYSEKKERRIEILEQLLAIDTTNGNEEEAADYLATCFAQSAIQTKKVLFAEKRANLIAEIGKGERVLGLSGHLDVVSAGDDELWESNPFIPTQRDGRMYARGATDMKSGLAAMVIAMLELEEEAVKLNGRVRLLATASEEIGLLGARQLTDEGYVDDLEALIIGEPTNKKIIYAHKGVLSFKVTSSGKTAHSSMPEKGINAIDNLLTYYQKQQMLFETFTQKNPILGKLVMTTSRIDGGFQVNSVPDNACLQVNVRTIPEVNNEYVIQQLQQLIIECQENNENLQLKLEITQNNQPVFSNKDSILIQIIQQQASSTFKESIPLEGVPWAADSAEFIRANREMPIVIFGPGNETLHQINEYVEIEEYLMMIDTYKAIIKKYLA